MTVISFEHSPAVAARRRSHTRIRSLSDDEVCSGGRSPSLHRPPFFAGMDEDHLHRHGLGFPIAAPPMECLPCGVRSCLRGLCQ